MKKVYSLFLLAFSMVAFAQGVEDFENSEIGGSYSDGSFTGVSGVEWSYTHSRDEGDFPIENKGLMLRRALDSSLSGTITGGIGSFTFEYRKAFTGGNIRQLEVYANDVVVGTTPEFGEGSGEQTEVYTFTVAIDSAEPVTIKIKNVGDGDFNRQTTIDNLSWTAYTMGVEDLDNNKVRLNSVWTDVANFIVDGKANVEIYNLNGQLVQKANGNNNFTVNVSSLTKGVYMVKLTVDGKVSTHKVVKK